MPQIYEQERSTDAGLSPDRDTIGALLVDHPWAVRFVAFETGLLALAAVIPLVGSGPFYYVLFGMVLSVAVLAAVVVAAFGVASGVKRLRLELRHATR